MCETAPNPAVVFICERPNDASIYPARRPKMKTMRTPKTIAEDISWKLNRKNQLDAMKRQLARKARARRKAVEKSSAEK